MLNAFETDLSSAMPVFTTMYKAGPDYVHQHLPIIHDVHYTSSETLQLVKVSRKCKIWMLLLKTCSKQKKCYLLPAESTRKERKISVFGSGPKFSSDTFRTVLSLA